MLFILLGKSYHLFSADVVEGVSICLLYRNQVTVSNNGVCLPAISGWLVSPPSQMMLSLKLADRSDTTLHRSCAVIIVVSWSVHTT